LSVNNYETVFIAEPEVSNDQVEQLVNKIKQNLTTHAGSLTAEDRWGRRRLAYPIQGHREGFYSVLTFSADSAIVASLEHLFNVTDTVIRHMTTRIIKKNKKFAPRREKPAGATDSRGSGRPGSSRPPRTESSSAPAASAPAPAAAAPATPAPVPAPAPEAPKTEPPASNGGATA
jgi:small subunit ribosomal protein S6